MEDSWGQAGSFGQCIVNIGVMREVNLRGLDLNLLVLLDALIEHRHVTRAADAAGLSQPAMSRALSRLRAMFDDPLLVRGAQGLLPTPKALALQAKLRRLLGEMRELVGDDAFEPARWRGSVRIAATDHQTILLLPRLMRRLAAEAPGLDVTVVPFRAEVMPALRDGALDLAFGIAEAPLPPPLTFEPLYEDRFVTVLRAGHPAVADWSLDRFVALDHVLVTVLGDGRGAVDDVLDRLGLSRRIALRLPHFYAALSVVAGTDLAVTLPSSIARRHAEAFRLAMLEPPIERPPFTITSVWSAVLDADPGHRWLRGVVRDEARSIEGVLPLQAGR
jgi:DNA-binding transcriptional LysR family regulator